jgi:hypothetical protein
VSAPGTGRWKVEPCGCALGVCWACWVCWRLAVRANVVERVGQVGQVKNRVGEKLCECAYAGCAVRGEARGGPWPC